MKYIQTKICKGSFVIEKHIDLDDFLNQDEQEKFCQLREVREERDSLSKADYKWYLEILNKIKEESDFVESEVVSYEVDDWAEYEDENYLVR